MLPPTGLSLDLLLQIAQYLSPQDGYALLRACPMLAKQFTFRQLRGIDSEDNTLLHLIAQNGELQLLRSIIHTNDSTTVLKKGIPFNAQNDFDCTPLHLAVEEQYEEVVKLLISQPNVDVNLRDLDHYLPVSRAVKLGNARMVQMFLDLRDDIILDRQPRGLPQADYTPILTMAAQEGHEDVVRLLLQRDDLKDDPPDRTDQTALSAAVAGECKSTVELLLHREDADYDPGSIRYSLCVTVVNGDIEIMRILLNRHEEVLNLGGVLGMTVLYEAIYYGWKEAAEYLLGLENIRADIPSEHNWTPLHQAAFSGLLPVVRMLLKRTSVDVDVNATTDEGATALMLAAEAGNEEIVDALLAQENIDLDTVDCHGKTALSLAAANNNMSIHRLLLAKGADPTVADDEG
ncbi:Ankyrin-3-like protein [Cladobotryum mycophilum]|uniref:Ankyrin-3-like protein n=1 Tax=Cladobotryum mycophilum TaxID=491253 RepID=A0ABR0SC58_9HYPO